MSRDLHMIIDCVLQRPESKFMRKLLSSWASARAWLATKKAQQMAQTESQCGMSLARGLLFSREGAERQENVVQCRAKWRFLENERIGLCYLKSNARASVRKVSYV